MFEYIKNILMKIIPQKYKLNKVEYDKGIKIKAESKEKQEDDIKNVNLFNLKIYARTVFYSLMIGFIYNYVYFNICLKTNIFDIIQPNELMFSWVGVTSLFVTVLVLFLTYVMILYAKYLVINEERKKNFYMYLVLAIIFFSLTVYFFLNRENDDLYDSYLSILMFELMTIMVSMFSIFKPNELIKSKLTLIETTIIILIILFTILYAMSESNKSIVKPQQLMISFKTDYNGKAYNNKCLYYIGKTMNVIIASQNKPTMEEESLITLYTSDISSVTYIKGANTVCNQK